MVQNKQICVLILGMHRSGTSSFTKILNLMGVDLGTKLIDPFDDNPKGFFEHEEIVNLNINFLESIGVDSNALVKNLPLNWFYDKEAKSFKEEVKNIIKKDFGSSKIFAIKDPRISLLIPVYLEALKELDIEIFCIIAERKIQNVLSSLNKRNNLSFEEGLESYKKYYESIYLHTKNIPNLVLSYDDLIDDPESVIKTISKKITSLSSCEYKKIKNKVEDFLDKKLRHYNISDDDFIYKIASENKILISDINDLKKARELDFSVIKDSLQKNSTYKNTVAELNSKLKELNLMYFNLKKENDNHISIINKKESEVVKYKTRASEQYTHNQYLNNLIKDKDSHILNLNIMLSNIERSFTWKIVKGWDFFIFLFFPKNSFMRMNYEKLLRFNQRIFNETLPNFGVKLIKTKNKKDFSFEKIFWNNFNKDKPETDILFINHDESRTGAPRIVFDVAKHMKNKYKVSVVSLSRGSMTSDFDEEFGNIIYPDEIYGGEDSLNQAKKIIEKTNPKIVYANSIGSHYFAIAAKELNIPVVFHIHELDIAINLMFRGKKRKEFKNFADVFIAVSNPVYNLLVNGLGCEINKTKLINAFVDRKKIIDNSNLISEENVSNEIGKVGDELIVMSVGMFIYRKGADTFMKVAKKIKDKGLNVKFVWIGSKPFKEPFMSDFEFYSKYFTLVQEKTNPFPYIKQSDIFVLPSREDPFPLVVLESMSLGKPTVIFKEAGGIFDAVKDSGVIVENFDEDKFVKAIEMLIHDKQKREEMGAKAVEYQKKYDSEFALIKIEKIIDDILSK